MVVWLDIISPSLLASRRIITPSRRVYSGLVTVHHCQALHACADSSVLYCPSCYTIISLTMSQYAVPGTPRVISPSPTPSEQGRRDYFASAKGRLSSQEPITEESDVLEDPELARARARSRSPQLQKRFSARMNGANGAGVSGVDGASSSSRLTRRKPDALPLNEPEGDSDKSLLSPASAALGLGREYWRTLSRSPSPLGLIPIHREWRTFIHKHEIPRKFLHVSIGFVTLYLYLKGCQSNAIHPVLLSLLIPIFATDFLRMRYP